MFKSITASAILLAFVIQTFSGQFIQLSYYLNPSAFSRNCENKARPKMHCNGKCQVMKKMQQEEKKDQQFPQRKSIDKNEVLSSRSFFLSLDIHLLIRPHIYFLNNDNTLINRAYSVFHPPQC